MKILQTILRTHCSTTLLLICIRKILEAVLILTPLYKSSAWKKLSIFSLSKLAMMTCSAIAFNPDISYISAKSRKLVTLTFKIDSSTLKNSQPRFWCDFQIWHILSLFHLCCFSSKSWTRQTRWQSWLVFIKTLVEVNQAILSWIL